MQRLWALCGCFTALHSSSPSCSPPISLYPVHSTVLVEPCPLGCMERCPAWSCSLSPQDDQIEQEKASQRLAGGCCALAAIYLMGKFYVANAGDSRYSPTGQPHPTW